MSRPLINLHSADDEVQWLPPAGQIRLRDGRTIKDDPCRWTIHTPTETFHIDWTRLVIAEGPHLNSIKRWVAHNLGSKSVSVAAKGYWFACTMFNTPAFIEAAQNRAEIPYLAFSQAMASLDAKNRWQLHAARDFYVWCESQQFPFFSEEVVERLKEIVIGGNAKGEAVRSADPQQGPLTALEVAELTAALRAAYIDKTMPIDQQAALWLALAFGANSSQFALMRENDIVPEYVDGQLVTTLVSVPRHKKGHTNSRAEFKTRKANRFVGRVLIDLIKENERVSPKGSSNEPRPLFRRKTRRDHSPGLEEWEWHLRAPEFTKLLQKAIRSLEIYGRDGSFLKLNTRRLRYTLASRMVAAGASPYALAAALDHSDLQNVGVYFDVQSDIVEHLDKAMAMVLADRAAKFAKIVDCEDDAINGGRPGSRRYVSDREKNLHEPIGTCGHNHYSNADRKQTGIDQGQAVHALLTQLDIMRSMFHEVDYMSAVNGTPQDRIKMLPVAIEHVLNLKVDNAIPKDRNESKKRFMKAVAGLVKAFRIASGTAEADEVKDEVGFFTAVQAAIRKMDAGSRSGRSVDEADVAISQLLNRAVMSTEIVDILEAAGIDRPDIGVLSEEFLLGLKNNPHKSLAVEALKKLLNGEIRTRTRTNNTKREAFSKRLEEALARYHNRSVDALEVIQEMIAIAKELQEEPEDGLSPEEVAFYDALAANQSAIELMGNEELRVIATELVMTVRQNARVDWWRRDDIRKKMRVSIRRILRKHGFPPDLQSEAIKKVVQQAEVLAREIA